MRRPLLQDLDLKLHDADAVTDGIQAKGRLASIDNSKLVILCGLLFFTLLGMSGYCMKLLNVNQHQIMVCSFVIVYVYFLYIY